jgi:RHS repeat-associated protein
VDAAGDVDGDGYADFLIGADEHDVGALDRAGRIFLYYGDPVTGNITLGWTDYGTMNNGRFGHDVGSAGDVNGDGLLDLIVGEQLYTGPDSSEGRALVYHADFTIGVEQETTIVYEYDPLYRLTEATYSGDITATYSYIYDEVGNITAYTETIDGQTTAVTRTFDAGNRLEISYSGGVTTTYGYDDNGNLNDDGTRKYGYDQRNLLITSTVYISGTGYVPLADYIYDGASNRVLEADDGTDQTRYLFGMDLIHQDSGSETRYLLADGLGSVRTELVNDAVEAVTTYSPYGNLLAQTGASGTVYGFTGEQYDSSADLLYLRARYYNPVLRAFSSADMWSGSVWRPQTLNRYSYALNNPLRYTDPSGHCVDAHSGEVLMDQYPFGTSGICPDTETPPVPENEPVVHSVTPGFQVIIMPEGYEPTPINQDLSRALGYVNALVDVGETTMAVAVLLGAAPARGAQLSVSIADVIVAGAASYFAGETGPVTLHESLPEMLIFGQDVLFTSVEMAAIPPIQFGLMCYGMANGLIPGAMTGFVVGQGLDIGTSLFSAAYDIGRAEGIVPQWVSLGFYWDESANTRIPLPGVPSGQLVTVAIIYR